MPREYRLQRGEVSPGHKGSTDDQEHEEAHPPRDNWADIFTQRKADGKAVQLLVLTIDSPDIACIRRNCGLVGKPESLNLHITILERKYI